MKKQVFATLVGVTLFFNHSFAYLGPNDKGNKKPISGTKGANCSPATAKLTMEFNDVRALIEQGGSMFQNRAAGTAAYEVPKGSNLFAIYAGALWMGGTDVNGQLKLAALRYRQGNDFWPGPLTATPGTGNYNPQGAVGFDAVRDFGEANIDPDQCLAYDKFYTIRRAEVQRFIIWWECNTGVSTEGCDDITQPTNDELDRIYGWPAHGDVSRGQDYWLAPFYDRDGDGNYNPDVAGNQFNKCFQFSGGTPLFPDQNTNRYYLEQQCRGAGDVNNAELSEQAQQPLYSVNGDQVIPKLNDAGEYDKDSQGLCTWWSIDDPKGKDPYLPGKCLISPDFYNPMAECILPADNSEEIIFKSDDPDQSITTRDDLIGDGENITYLRNIKKGGGCNVLPKFNWIIGVCQGVSCDGWYDHNADGTSTDVLKPYKNVGSQLKLNYVAAYNFHPTKNKWIISGDSSFNTDGSKDSYDTILAHGGLDPESDTDSSKNPWLTPLPGGAALWGTGYYPIYAEGLGPGTKINEDGQVDESGVESEGMMFIISTESSYNFAWYMLNQENLNRGGVARRASHNDEEYDCLEPSNCWTDGNSGEIDFLESPFASGRAIRDTSDQVPSTPNAPTIIEQRCGDPDATEGSCPGIKGAAANDYRRLYLNNLNQFGRSFPTTVGASIGGWDGVSETNAYMVGSDPTLMDGDGKLKEQPIIYCAVVDKIGTWVYRIPQNSKDGRKLFGNYLDEDSVWSDSTNGSTKNGLSRFQAAKELDNTLNTPPDSFQSELDGHDGFTAIFIPFCQSEYGNSLQTTFCGTTKTSGFCNNWFSLLKNTGQWQYKKENHSWERPNLGWNNTDSPFTQLSNYIKGLLYGENSIYFMDERSIDDGTIINPKGSSDTDPNDPDHNYYGLGYNIDMVPFKCKKPFDEHCEDRKIGKSCALGNCNEKHSDEAGCNSDTMCQWNASDNTCNNTDWVTEYGIEPKLKHCCRNDSNPDICSNNDPCSYCNLPDSEAQKLANDDDIDPACNADGDQEKCENVKQMTPQQKCLQKRGYFSIGNDNDMKDFPWVDMNDTELKNLPCSNEPFGKEFTNVDNVKSMELVSYGFQDKQDYMINCPSKILLGSDQPWNLEDDEICAN